MTKAFASMLGAEILTYVRDMVLDVATKRRSFFEQSAAVGGVPLNKTELAELAALDAAAAMIQFAISVGQEAVVDKKPAPQWVLKIASQARVALVAPEETEAET
jgi:hypothetical protein